MAGFGEVEGGLLGVNEAGDADQQLEGYTAEDWQQQGAYAAMPMQMPWMNVPFWQPMTGGRWHKPAKPKNFSSLQEGYQKARFCATFPNISRCRHGSACTFAHTREEISAPLLSEEEETYVPSALTEDFFINRYKTLWCPIGAQHDWQVCMYAHTFQDARRPPSIGYGHQLCPYWNKKDTSLAYSQRCPLGPRCPHAHGAKEQLYHPAYFRTLVCRDLQRRRCPRGPLCAFFHRQTDARKAPADDVDYAMPLKKEDVKSEWVTYFLNPPRFQEAAGMDSTDAFAASMAFGMPGGCAPAFAPVEGASSSSGLPAGVFAPGAPGAFDYGAMCMPVAKPPMPEGTPRTQTTAEDAGSAAGEAEEGAEDSVEELSGGEEASLQMAAAAGSWPGPMPKGGEEAYWSAMQYPAAYGMYPGYFPGYFDGMAMYPPQGPVAGQGGGSKGGGRGGGKRSWAKGRKA